MPDVDEAFSWFVRTEAASLQRSAWLLTSDWAAADDLVQVALLKTWARWGKIRDPAAAGTYARKVMVTTFLGWRRRRSSTELITEHVPEQPAPGEGFSEIDVYLALTTAVRALPPGQRAVVVLRYFDDLTEQRTAEILGCSVGTVKSQAARALHALRAVPSLRALLSEDSHEQPC